MNQFKYNQADINQLISKLRIKIEPRYRNMKQPEGPDGRLKILRSVVTALFKYERIETTYTKADEARGYAERLISEAIRHGDSHKPTMDTATFWLTEKQLIHKLFKVLAPRYVNYQSAYTSLYKAPLGYPKTHRTLSLLELKGNPFPPIIFDGSRNKNFIHNVLLEEARKEFNRSKQAEIVARISSSEKQKPSSTNTEQKDVLNKAAVEVSEGEQLLKFSSIENLDSCVLEKSKSEMDKNTSNDPVIV